MASHSKQIILFWILISGMNAFSACSQITDFFSGSSTNSSIIREKTAVTRYTSILPPFKPSQFAWFYKPPKEPEEISKIASEFSFFVFTRNDEPTVEKLDENDATGDVVQYLRFEAVMDPGDCQSKPFQNQVANLEGDFCIIRDQHPDWFLQDINKRPIKFDGNGYVMMDPGNKEWNSFAIEKVLGFQNDPIWNGVFMDNVDASLGRFDAQNILLRSYSDDQIFQEAVEGNLAGLSKALHDKQKTLFANITFLRQKEVWFRYLEHLDGAMLETFAADWNSGYISETEWLTQLEIAEATQDLGKKIILVTQGDPDDRNRMLFGFASFLLVNNGKAFFRYSNDEAYREVWWYPEFELDLGQPLGPKYIESGFWRRDFEKGSVTVNPVNHLAEIKLD